MNTFTYLFLLFLIASYAVEFWLSQRQKHHVFQHRSAVPPAFEATISLATHQKAADYTLEKNKLSDIDGVVGVVVLLLLTVGGGINWAFTSWTALQLSPLVTGLGATATIFLLMTVVELPSSYYQTFVIEEKFGFNKSTVSQFVKDQ